MIFCTLACRLHRNVFLQVKHDMGTSQADGTLSVTDMWKRHSQIEKQSDQATIHIHKSTLVLP
jgi:hypothetical protein